MFKRFFKKKAPVQFETKPRYTRAVTEREYNTAFDIICKELEVANNYATDTTLEAQIVQGVYGERLDEFKQKLENKEITQTEFNEMQLAITREGADIVKKQQDETANYLKDIRAESIVLFKKIVKEYNDFYSFPLREGVIVEVPSNLTAKQHAVLTKLINAKGMAQNEVSQLDYLERAYKECVASKINIKVNNVSLLEGSFDLANMPVRDYPAVITHLPTILHATSFIFDIMEEEFKKKR